MPILRYWDVASNQYIAIPGVSAASPNNMVATIINTPTAASSPYTITHNMSTTNVMVQAWDTVTNDLIIVRMHIADANHVQIFFEQNCPNNVNVMVIGGVGSRSLLFPWTMDPANITGANTVPNGPYWARAARIVEGGSWSISKLGVYVGASSGNINLAVFHDNGANRPGVLVASTGSVACPASNTRGLLPLGSTVGVNQGDWLALTADNTTATFGDSSVQGIGAVQPSWSVAIWSIGSLVFASNPTSPQDDPFKFSLWGEP